MLTKETKKSVIGKEDLESYKQVCICGDILLCEIIKMGNTYKINLIYFVRMFTLSEAYET